MFKFQWQFQWQKIANKTNFFRFSLPYLYEQVL